jgi:hypothetical protein
MQCHGDAEAVSTALARSGKPLKTVRLGLLPFFTGLKPRC